MAADDQTGTYEIRNGFTTSFGMINGQRWCDVKFTRGIDIIDLRIRREATVDEALRNLWRRRRHRTVFLNEIEVELDILRQNQKTENADTHVWRCKSGYKSHFSTQETWKLVRGEGLECSWIYGVWFSQAIPKFPFIIWLAGCRLWTERRDGILEWIKHLSFVTPFRSRRTTCSSNVLTRHRPGSSL